MPKNMEKFERLVKRASKCQNIKKCYGSEIRKWKRDSIIFKGIVVPGICPRFGRKKIKVLFVGERPGRVGTGKSGMIAPCNDDPSAEFFRKCLDEKFRQIAKIELEHIVFTNACLCRPLLIKNFKKQLGSCGTCGRSPDTYRDKSPQAIVNRCMKTWFLKQLKILNPEYIVTLGGKPLNGLKKVFSVLRGTTLKNFSKKSDPIKIEDYNYKGYVYPLYHTSAQVRRTLPDHKRLNGWEKLATLLKQHRVTSNQ